MKLKLKKFVKPHAMIEEEDKEDPVALEQLWRPPNVDDLLKDRIANKSPRMIDALKKEIKELLHCQAQAHRHAAESLQCLETI